MLRRRYCHGIIPGTFDVQFALYVDVDRLQRALRRVVLCGRIREVFPRGRRLLRCLGLTIQRRVDLRGAFLRPDVGADGKTGLLHRLAELFSTLCRRLEVLRDLRPDGHENGADDSDDAEGRMEV